jgi:hypothetical protein
MRFQDGLGFGSQRSVVSPRRKTGSETSERDYGSKAAGRNGSHVVLRTARQEAPQTTVEGKSDLPTVPSQATEGRYIN